MTINRSLTIIGTFCAFLFAAITWLSWGLPERFCIFLDNMTGNLFQETILEMHNGFYYEHLNNTMPTVPYLILFFIIFALVLFALRILEKKESNAESLKIILGFAILFRLLVFFGEPIHENDIYRYLWDGKVALNGINPFKYAPSDLFMVENDIDYDYFDITHDVELRYKDFSQADRIEVKELIALRDQNRELYDRIGHWQVPTIYPPVAQSVFMLSSLIRSDSLNFMRFLFVLFDVGVLFVLVGLLKHFKLNPCYVLVYGWLPLVVIQLALSGHYDAVAIFLCVLSFLLFVKKKTYWACSVLALATLTKLFPLVLFPLMFQKKWFKHGVLFAGIITVFYIPYFVWGNTGVVGVFEGLMTYSRDWSYHAFFFDVIYYTYQWINPELVATLMPAKITVGLIYVGVLGYLILDRARSQTRVMHKVFLAIALLFVLNPVCDPWYYCWVIPFLCFFRYRSWIWLSSLLMLSYLNFHTDIAWAGWRFLEIKSIVWLTYLPFLGMLGWEKWRDRVST